MTVRELIAALLKMPADAPVVIYDRFQAQSTVEPELITFDPEDDVYGDVLPDDCTQYVGL